MFTVECPKRSETILRRELITRTRRGLSFVIGEVEATTGFEPVIGVLQTPALTTWLRRPDLLR